MKKVIFLLLIILMGIGVFFHFRYAAFYKYNSFTANWNIKNKQYKMLLLIKQKSLTEYNEVAKQYNISYASVDTLGMSVTKWNGIRDYD